MVGETDLCALLKSMNARLVDGLYVFVTLKGKVLPEGVSPRMVFQETEGTTLVLLKEEAEEQGGHPQASVIGAGLKTSTTQAALINGAAGHAHDYDDVHTAMSGHPTVPVAPAVLAIVLGPLAERSLRQSLISSRGDVMTFFERPISLACMLIAALLIIYPILLGIRRRKKAREEGAEA